jgi:hypothetical protein
VSSPLDGRIRVIARDELESLMGGASSDESLQEQVRGLHEEVHMAVTLVKRLAERVEALESAAAAPARRARKTPVADA